jgi:hypothetical protein
MKTELSVEAIGAKARSILKAGAVGKITATFERSCYLETGGDWICLAASGTGRGPITLTCQQFGNDWPSGQLREGLLVRVDRDGLRLGANIHVATADAVTWRPPPPPDWTVASLIEGLGLLREHASEMLPREGLAAFLLDDAPDLVGAPTPREALAATPSIALLRGWLVQGSGLPDQRVTGLVGLGPGLTPSGDDLLGGAMISLHLLGRPERAAALYRTVRPALADGTNAVSRALLAAAADGMGGESLHAALNAVLSADRSIMTDNLQAIDRIGHSSGWDALTGAIMVLRHWVKTRPDQGQE